MDKIPFEDGTLVKAGYVEIDGTKHETVQPEYTGKTPLSAYNLKKMQDNIENSINEEKLVKRINISGASKQETREGYNLINVLNINTTTINGITFTSLGDGTIKANGTATANATFKFTEADGSGDRVTRLEEGTYTLYCKNSDYSKAFLQMGIKHDNGTEEWHNASSLKTIETAGANYSALIYVRSGVTLDNVVFKPMLLKGTYTVDTIPEFEQYGASPSIEYEAPIDSVGDNINEFDMEKYPFTGGVAYNGTELTWWTGYCGIQGYFPVKEQKTYSFSNNLGLPIAFGLVFYDKDKNAISSISKDTTTFTTPEKCEYIRFAIKSATIPSWVKICKGTSTGPYSPYGMGSVEIEHCNKNFWKINNASFTPTVISWHDFNGISNMYNNSQYNNSKAKIKLKAGNYFISYGEMVNIGTVQTIKIDGSTNGVVLVTGKGAFTLTEDSEIMIRLSVSTANVKASISNVQIALGTEEKEYVPHQSQTKALYTQQPFRAIGDVKDRFLKQNGVWYEKHNIGETVLDGTQGNMYAQPEIGRYDYKIPNAKMQGLCLSTHFVYKYAVEDGKIFLGGTQANRVCIVCASITSLQDMNAWLSENNVVVVYELATPTLIECTAEQVEVLNDIYSAYGEGMTNIICNDEIEPVIEIVKETKETVQSENDKAISALLARVTELETIVATLQTATAEEGA